MLQSDPQTIPVLQGEIMAIDALFKRIAERGRRIRTQKQIGYSDHVEEPITIEEAHSQKVVRVENSSSEMGDKDPVLGE